VRNKRKKDRLDPSLAPLVVVSLVGHFVFFGVFMLLPSKSTADEQPLYQVQEVNLVYADEIGGGVWGEPKRGPMHKGRIKLPPSQRSVNVSPSKPSIKVGVPTKTKKKKNRQEGINIPDELREAISNLNKNREGEYTRPDGDPKSTNPGPPGPPGGDICSVYRKRASRLIRRSGSVPEAAGKSTSIAVTIGPGGGVSSKRITRSSGVPHADSVALSLVPGTFGAPPAECGSIGLRVRVRFHGKSTRKGLNESNSRKRRSEKSSGDPIQRALDDL